VISVVEVNSRVAVISGLAVVDIVVLIGLFRLFIEYISFKPFFNLPGFVESVFAGIVEIAVTGVVTVLFDGIVEMVVTGVVRVLI